MHEKQKFETGGEKCTPPNNYAIRRPDLLITRIDAYLVPISGITYISLLEILDKLVNGLNPFSRNTWY